MCARRAGGVEAFLVGVAGARGLGEQLGVAFPQNCRRRAVPLELLLGNGQARGDLFLHRPSRLEVYSRRLLCCAGLAKLDAPGFQLGLESRRRRRSWLGLGRLGLSWLGCRGFGRGGFGGGLGLRWRRYPAELLEVVDVLTHRIGHSRAVGSSCVGPLLDVGLTGLGGVLGSGLRGEFGGLDRRFGCGEAGLSLFPGDAQLLRDLSARGKFVLDCLDLLAEALGHAELGEDLRREWADKVSGWARRRLGKRG